MSKTTSLYLRKGSFARLAKLAAAGNYLQTRGAGTGVTPSVSQFVDAIGAGELVAIGPFPRWRDVLSALDAALQTATLTADQADILAAIRRQVVTMPTSIRMIETNVRSVARS